MSATAKIDYKRELHALYTASARPAMLDVPELAFLQIDGRGDPNTAPQFAEAIQALYAIAYTAKFALKRAPEGIDYGVMPLEGLYRAEDPSVFAAGEKSSWEWTLMIMQPDEVTAEVFRDARAHAQESKRVDAIARVRLERFAEGPSAQTMHVGPYSEEGPTIERLHAFIAEHGCRPVGAHHEIYLSDPRRCAPERMKTILRQPVARAD